MNQLSHMSSYAISIIVGALATGKEDVQIMCSPEASFMDLGDTFQWYFTRTTIDNGIQLRGMASTQCLDQHLKFSPSETSA